MSEFIASTHDPQAFRQLSGGYNREMVKEGLVVELSEGLRKIRRLFLFHDVLVSAKQKPTRWASFRECGDFSTWGYIM